MWMVYMGLAWGYLGLPKTPGHRTFWRRDSPNMLVLPGKPEEIGPPGLPPRTSRSRRAVRR